MVEHKILKVEGMRNALGRGDIMGDLEDDLQRLEKKGWEVAEELSEKKGATCGLILKRDEDYEPENTFG